MSDFFTHPSAVIDEGAEIGNGTKIWHFSHVMGDSYIGENCSLGQNVFVASGVKIGDNVKIQNNVSVYTGVILEDDVFLGPSMVFTNVINPRSHVERKDQYQQTVVKRGATIGANATILCGITLGEFAFVGAGAVVTKDVPAYGLVYGNPARLGGWMCACGEQLEISGTKPSEQVTCASCGSAYTLVSAKEIKPVKKGNA
jgi:UDP-2-acetamido-3-amino-2,3-dideoxy-glucuronate N-acetyltransferase